MGASHLDLHSEGLSVSGAPRGPALPLLSPLRPGATVESVVSALSLPTPPTPRSAGCFGVSGPRLEVHASVRGVRARCGCAHGRRGSHLSAHRQGLSASGGGAGPSPSGSSSIPLPRGLGCFGEARSRVDPRSVIRAPRSS